MDQVAIQAATYAEVGARLGGCGAARAGTGGPRGRGRRTNPTSGGWASSRASITKLVAIAFGMSAP